MTSAHTPSDDTATIDVTDLMDTNAGDETHLDENWVECDACGVDSPADYDECFDCGAKL